MNKTISNTVYKPFTPAGRAGKRLIYLTVMRHGRGDEKTKKSDLEDLQKAHAPMTRALFEQSKIILLDSY